MDEAGKKRDKIVSIQRLKEKKKARKQLSRLGDGIPNRPIFAIIVGVDLFGWRGEKKKGVVRLSGHTALRNMRGNFAPSGQAAAGGRKRLTSIVARVGIGRNGVGSNRGRHCRSSSRSSDAGIVHHHGKGQATGREVVVEVECGDDDEAGRMSLAAAVVVRGCVCVCVCVCVWQWLQAGRKGDFKQGKGRWVGWRFVVGQRPGPSNGADARGATMGWSAGLGGE
jgi:hypothetical protein